MVLARRARVVACQRHAAKRIKSARAARIAAILIRKNQIARAASLAGILGVADATQTLSWPSEPFSRSHVQFQKKTS